jgi:hypothetical protein
MRGRAHRETVIRLEFSEEGLQGESRHTVDRSDMHGYEEAANTSLRRYGVL